MGGILAGKPRALKMGATYRLIADVGRDGLWQFLGPHVYAGFLEKAREGILKALEADAGFERAPAPDESWLLCAKAFAESEPVRAMAAYRRATSINPGVAHRVKPTCGLADLLEENGPG